MLESGSMFHERIEDCSAVQDIFLDFLVGVHERGHESEDVVEEGGRDGDDAFKGGAEYDVALFRCGMTLGFELKERVMGQGRGYGLWKWSLRLVLTGLISTPWILTGQFLAMTLASALVPTVERPRAKTCIPTRRYFNISLSHTFIKPGGNPFPTHSQASRTPSTPPNPLSSPQPHTLPPH